MRKLLYLLILCVFFCSCSSTPKAENPIEEGLSPQAEVTGSVQSSDVASESLAEVPESDTEVVGETSELPGISDSAEVFENTASAEESIVEDTTVSSSSKTLYKPLQLNRLPIDEKNRRRAIEETLSEEVLANLPFNDSVNSGSAVGGAESDVSEEKSVTDAGNTTDTVSTVSPVENNDSPETEANEPAIENADSISITDETDAEVPQPSDTVISIPEENADIQPTGVTEEDTAEQRTEDIAVEKQTEAVTKEADAKKGNSIAEIPTSQPESTVILPEKEEKSTQADDDTGTVTPLIVETTSAPDSTDSEKVANTGTSQENPQELSQNKTQTNQADEPLMSEVIDYEAIERDLQEETSDEKQYESDNIEYVKPSRSVTVFTGQTLEINYPGTGWSYLGEVLDIGLHVEYPKLSYLGSSNSADRETTFMLKPKDSGRTILHFCKEDSLTGETIDDYLEVLISRETAATSSAAVAPKYSEIVPDYQKTVPAPQDFTTDAKDTEETPPFSTEEDIVQNIEAIPSDSSALSEVPTETSNTVEQGTITTTDEISDLLEQARACYNDKKYSEAKQYVEKFLSTSYDNLDAGYFLLGQVLEADSEVKNIKNAMHAYRMVVDMYPQSQYWDSATKRYTYLLKYYFEI